MHGISPLYNKGKNKSESLKKKKKDKGEINQH